MILLIHYDNNKYFSISAIFFVVSIHTRKNEIE